MPALGKLEFYSRRERIMMDILIVQTFVPKLSKPLNYLRIISKEQPLLLLDLTMHFQLTLCLNSRSTGTGSMGSARCVMEPSQMANHRTFITLMITLTCQAGLRV
jgi:hypothetical protein